MHNESAPKKNHQFSFIESLPENDNGRFRNFHFAQVLNDIRQLEQWMKEDHIENNWDLKEKLAFLRNVEASIRTGAAVRRTQLAWFSIAIAVIAAFVGFIVGINS